MHRYLLLASALASLCFADVARAQQAPPYAGPGHVAALLPDQSVLVLGGAAADGTPTAAAQLFAPDGSFTDVGPMLGKRGYGTATQLRDGRVLVVGGEDASGPLATIELFELAPPGQPGGTFKASRAALVTARTSHDALVLADGRVLIRGGYDAAGVALDPSLDELYDPATDSIAHADPTLEYATVYTDKPDYFPGDTVYVKGGRWQPGEDVHLLFDADPLTIAPRVVTVTADANGQLQGSNGELLASLVIDQTDLHKFFTLHAVGATSAVSAVAYFTDANPQITSFTPASGPIQGGGDFTINGQDLLTQSINKVQFGVGANAVVVDLTAAKTKSNTQVVITLPAYPVTGAVRVAMMNNGTAKAIASSTFDYVKGTRSISLSLADKTYGAAPFSVTATISPPAPVTYSGSGSCSVTAGGSVSISGAGTCSVTASVQETSDYAAASLTQAFSISKAALTVTAKPSTKGYGAALPGFEVTYATFVNGDDPSKLGGTLAFDTAATAASPVGSYAVTPKGLTSANYDITFANGTLTVTGAPLTITADPKTKVYGADLPTFTASYSGFVNGDTAVTTAPTCTTAATKVSPVGSYDITCTGAVAGNYVISYVKGSLTISSAPLTVTADAQTKEYGDADPTLTYKVTSGSLVGADAFTGSLTRVAGNDVGTYAIQQGTLALSSNYSLTYVGANLTIEARKITVTADAQKKTYGDADPALSYQITNGSLVGADKFTGALSRTAGESVGTYAIGQGTLALNDNYVLTYVGANLTIEKRAVTVTVAAKSKTYGDADPTLTYAITSGSLAFSDAFTGALSRATGEAVGAYAIGQGTLALNDNYVLTYVGANLTIEKRAVTVTVAAKSKTYGDADPTLTYAITNGSLAFSDAFSGALSRTAGESVGTYAIGQGTLALNDNYVLTYVGANLTIEKRAVTVTADVKTKVYGDAEPALTYKITSGSLAFSDAFSGELSRDQGESVGTYAITQGSVALSGNYSLTYVGASLTISKKAASVVVAAASKIYGAADPAFTGTLTGFLPSDAVAASYSRAVGETVGSYQITASLSPAGALGNYDITNSPATFTISKKAASVVVAAASKIYGAADPMFTGTLTGFLPSDAVAASYSRAVGETVGSYQITASLSPAGALGNYDITNSPATFTISKKAASVVVTAAGKIYGAADPTFTGTLSGFLAADGVTSTYSRVAGETVGTYAITASLSPAGVLGNYDITNTPGDLTITQKPVTATVTASSKPYDGGVAAVITSCTVGPKVGGDVVDCSVGSASFASASVGTDKAVTATGIALTGPASSNYVLAATSATTKASITAEWTDFLQPINRTNNSVFKKGSTIPVKFQLTGASAAITNLTARLYAQQMADQPIGTELEAISTSAADTGNQFRYDGSQYIFNLSTKTLAVGTWQIRADLGDGVVHTILVSLK